MEFILCDDNARFTETFAVRLRRISAEKGWDVTVRTYQSPFAVLRFAEIPSKKRARIYFLDVDMPGLTGFQLAANLQKMDPKAMIVFVSARDELVFQSMEFHPFYFLRKTILDNELDGQLMRLYRELGKDHHHVYFTCRKQKFDIIPERVPYVESDRNYVLMYSDEGNPPLRIRVKLTELENQWKEFGFVRVHKSFLVNKKFMVDLENKQLRLTTGQTADVGRNWISGIRKYLAGESAGEEAT